MHTVYGAETSLPRPAPPYPTPPSTPPAHRAAEAKPLSMQRSNNEKIAIHLLLYKAIEVILVAMTQEHEVKRRELLEVDGRRVVAGMWKLGVR